MQFSCVGIFTFHHVQELSVTPSFLGGEMALYVKINLPMFCRPCPHSEMNAPALLRGWLTQPALSNDSLKGWCGSCDTSAAPSLKDTPCHGNCINICLPIQGKVFREYKRLQFIILYKKRPSLCVWLYFWLVDRESYVWWWGHQISYLYKMQYVLCTVLHNMCEIWWQEVGTVHNVMLKEKWWNMLICFLAKG